MKQLHGFSWHRILLAIAVMLPILGLLGPELKSQESNDEVRANAEQLVKLGRQIFRYDTFGDEAFWGGTLQLHQAIEGSANGGVGPGLTPAAALAAGLKVDFDSLPNALVGQIKAGKVNLNDPATTLALLKLNAVVGVKGIFNSSGQLQSVGIQCALCHSTVDSSFPQFCPSSVQPNPGTGCIGHRLDGWANRDLNVGAIVSLAPNLTPVANLLRTSTDGVKNVMLNWGPGKFDAELFLDGQGFGPGGKSAAVLIPPAFGLGGVNLHTWTGWGSVPHWNAFVANLEMHGVGRFYDPRLDNATQFPIAAVNGFGDLKQSNGTYVDPAHDQVTSKLAPLQFYQLALQSPQPTKGSYDSAAAGRGEVLFSGKANCNQCHVTPLWSDPGWNLHQASEVCADTFQSSRAPDQRYRTPPLGALFTHTKGGFYHDGRFATLLDVVDHYNGCMNLRLTNNEESDLVQYLMSLTFGPQKAPKVSN